eukprot:CAMPEP_0174261526 /NCGR_PEP_ID=MMETSP0439-20130205/11481_1 /TAXON_ID=0 /ORGANISM="Stereomyxa ramosa, Strain Chinc5" /LENGTH=339 /DNA_ID=CAMNT_0015346009 /DNA_START=182 /DNA_END=1201 /DNA_ORIENTATION=+
MVETELEKWKRRIAHELKDIEQKVLSQEPSLTHDVQRILFSKEKEQRLEYHVDPSRTEPLPFPFRLLDRNWYATTTEEERVEAVLKWKPFKKEELELRDLEKAFKENPFSQQSSTDKTEWELRKYRQTRLQKFFGSEVGGSLSNLLAFKRQLRLKREADTRLSAELLDEISSLEGVEELAEGEVELSEELFYATEGLPYHRTPHNLNSDLDSYYVPSNFYKKPCLFCNPPDKRPVLEPMNIALLTTFMTGSGEIIGRKDTHCCPKHQKQLSKTIKRARSMGFFSYKKGGFTVTSPFHPPPTKNPHTSRYENVYDAKTFDNNIPSYLIPNEYDSYDSDKE